MTRAILIVFIGFPCAIIGALCFVIREGFEIGYFYAKEIWAAEKMK